MTESRPTGRHHEQASRATTPVSSPRTARGGKLGSASSLLRSLPRSRSHLTFPLRSETLLDEMPIGLGEFYLMVRTRGCYGYPCYAGEIGYLSSNLYLFPTMEFYLI